MLEMHHKAIERFKALIKFDEEAKAIALKRLRRQLCEVPINGEEFNKIRAEIAGTMKLYDENNEMYLIAIQGIELLISKAIVLHN